MSFQGDMAIPIIKGLTCALSFWSKTRGMILAFVREALFVANNAIFTWTSLSAPTISMNKKQTN